MRAYTFTHVYISQIQHGIQAGHCLMDLRQRYPEDSLEGKYAIEWADNHKTMICLNGGNSAMLRDLLIKLTELSEKLNLPVCDFREDADSMEGMRTAVGIIVPEFIYNADYDRMTQTASYQDAPLTATELELYQLIKSYRLA